jgi:hypothetical protein
MVGICLYVVYVMYDCCNCVVGLNWIKGERGLGTPCVGNFGGKSCMPVKVGGFPREIEDSCFEAK